MYNIKRYSFLIIVIVLLLSTTLSADLTYKQKMVMSGIPMMGNITMDQTYLLKGDNLAVEQSMQNPMMPQMTTRTRSIVKGGKEVIIVNYIDSTYTTFGKAKIDSLANFMDNLDEMIDSLKEMVSINKLSMELTGNTKEIEGYKCEELVFDADVDMRMQVMGPEPLPMNFKLSGTYWATRDFPEHKDYENMITVMENIFAQNGQSGMSAIIPMLEKLGIDSKQLEDAMEFSKMLMLEGFMDITIDMEMTEEMKQSMGQMFKMPMSMKISFDLVDVSNSKINDSEFVQPAGFKKVDELSIPGGGGFNPLGL